MEASELLSFLTFLASAKTATHTPFGYFAFKSAIDAKYSKSSSRVASISSSESHPTPPGFAAYSNLTVASGLRELLVGVPFEADALGCIALSSILINKFKAFKSFISSPL